MSVCQSVYYSAQTLRVVDVVRVYVY